MAAGTRSDRVKRLRLRAFRRATRRRPWRRMSRLSLRRFVDSRNTTVDAPAPALPRLVTAARSENDLPASTVVGGRPTLVTERSGRAGAWASAASPSPRAAVPVANRIHPAERLIGAR